MEMERDLFKRQTLRQRLRQLGNVRTLASTLEVIFSTSMRNCFDAIMDHSLLSGFSNEGDLFIQENMNGSVSPEERSPEKEEEEEEEEEEEVVLSKPPFLKKLSPEPRPLQDHRRVFHLQIEEEERDES